ncbi:MAG: hypothetical protein ACYDC3_05560 [Candidatus Binataceae bacterium]
MRHNTRLLRVAVVLAILFGAGIVLGVGYRLYQGSIIPNPFFVTAAGNLTPSASEALSSNVATVNVPAAPTAASSPELSAAIIPNAPIAPSPTPAPAQNTASQNTASNVVVLNQVKPPSPPPPPPGGNALMLPQVQPQESTTDRIPVIGSEGQTIWVPQAIEGCWEGRGGSRLQYLGGCPNLMSGSTSPITLRWCFRRMGTQPLTLTMAKGQYPGRVQQRWEVMSAQGQTMHLRETISYNTMMFMHVVDVGDWSCRITPADELACDENELARCGPAKWMQPPWFRGSGWVTSRRVSGGNLGRPVSSMR